jgi:WD40 repeat protein
MIAHRSPISGVATFGSRYVATAGYDNQLILWDAEHKTPLQRAAHDHLANQVAFSPDGRFLVSSSSDYTARLWSVPELRLVAVMSGQRDDVEMSVFHPSEELIATASRDHNVRVYDFAGRMKLCFEGHSADVISVAWSTDGRELISSSDDGTIKRWSLDTAELVDDIDLGGIETDTIAITREGVIYAGNDEGQIVVIDGGRTSLTAAHEAGIKRLVYQADEGLLVSLSYDRTLRVWSTLAGLEPVARSQMPAEIWPRSCAFLDAQTLAFATFGSSYALYHVDSDRWDLQGVLSTPGVNAVAVHEGRMLTIGDAGILHVDGRPSTELGSLCNFLTPAGPRVFTGGQMGRVMDALTGELLYQHRSPLNCGGSFERNGMTPVVVGAYTGEGLVFSVAADGRVEHVATLPLHANAVKAVAVSGGIIFSVCADTGASWFATETLDEIGRAQEAHDRIANGCAALPGGRFVSVSRYYRLRLWNGSHATIVATPHDRSIKCVAASDCGRYVASGSYFGAVAVYDVERASWLRVQRPTTAGISSLCFDAVRQVFFAGSYDSRVYEIGMGA